MAFLTVSGISKLEKKVFTVRDIHFTQSSRQKIVIAGETGSGKTTLLRMIAGWVQPDAGEIKQLLGTRDT
jgi:ABC-type Fe3+/spermidine/putrescine transport system ATPase subunit